MMPVSAKRLLLGFPVILTTMVSPLPKLGVADASQTAARAVEREWDYALQASDLVVRGVVVNVSDSEVPVADFWGVHSEVVEPAALITFRVDEVLRGPSVSGHFRFIAYCPPTAARIVFSVGSEMLICAFYHPSLETYYQADYHGRYFRSAEGWLSGPTPSEERTFSDQDLRRKIEETALESVATEADLVVEGVVESADTSRVYGPDSTSAELVTLSLRVVKVKKGRMADDRLRVAVVTRGIYWPEWRRTVPRSYAVGQKWLCFLRRGDHGWYPFAGSNGLFQVVDQKLIYADRVEYWRTRSSVDKVVESVREGDDR